MFPNLFLLIFLAAFALTRNELVFELVVCSRASLVLFLVSFTLFPSTLQAYEMSNLSTSPHSRFLEKIWENYRFVCRIIANLCGGSVEVAHTTIKRCNFTVKTNFIKMEACLLQQRGNDFGSMCHFHVANVRCILSKFLQKYVWSLSVMHLHLSLFHSSTKYPRPISQLKRQWGCFLSVLVHPEEHWWLTWNMSTWYALLKALPTSKKDWSLKLYSQAEGKRNQEQSAWLTEEKCCIHCWSRHNKVLKRQLQMIHLVEQFVDTLVETYTFGEPNGWIEFLSWNIFS